jgi:DNA-binding response OmpR family regulator
VARILVVEDDQDLNKAYCIILKHEGHEIVTAFDGKQALSKLNDFEPDLVLLDLLMPIMGGLEFLKKWTNTKRKDVKVLIFTNMENSPEISEAYKLGANRCIIKSWTAPHNLARVVSDTLKSEKSESKKSVKTTT